jgi:hypothetical protein
MQTKSSTGKSNIMGRLVDEMVTNVSGQFRGVDSPSEHTKEQTEEQTLGRTDKRTHSQSDSQSVGQSNRHTEDHTKGHTEEQTVKQAKGQSEGQSEEHSEEQSAKRDSSATHVLTTWDRSDPPFAHFTERQSAVLAFMIHSKDKYITLDYIAYATGLTFASVRTAIRALRQYNCVLNTGRLRHLNTQYLYYELDEVLCEQFWKEKGIFYDFSRPLKWDRNGMNRSADTKSVQTKGHTEGQSEEHTEEQTLGRTDSRTDIYSSSSSISIYNNKLLLTEVAEIFATHPDFAFWIEEKLKPDTVLRWIEEFSDVPIKVEDMLLYLSRCSYDLTTLNKKASLKNTPVNYFYGCIKRNKTYLPPHGFKTLEERILEDKRKIVEEMENRVRELQEMEEREKQVEIEIKFREMMGEETGELYRTCLNNIPSLFRNSDRSGPGFKTAMKQAFIKVPNN